MELRNVLKVVSCLLFIAWIAKGNNTTVKGDSVCKDETPDCGYYNENKSCDNRHFALLYCRKHCDLCKVCNIPTEDKGNSSLTLTWDNNTNNFQLNYKCNEGYYHDKGSLTRTCDKETWTGSMPVCSKVLGRACMNNKDCTDLLPNSTCTSKICSCSTNFSPIGNKCLKDCDATVLENMNKTALNKDINTAFGSTATITCEHGYVIFGSYNKTYFNMTCSHNGLWSNKQKCVPIG
ncbi:sushi, von Willebrand factor type A, EGF and pentraxin domain-containing protein 1-like [Ruditapes philippinarum]|uniref:sushi, von Willebrand factor type A, EGF and pentraxin domain-containing protein 1-like n=1 Tax=Ruditapes philippinarum TaxID=129788 RepID=UPI00295B0E7A|nr:sushi, von Willebrand factor type A, EGF and pentraxin domain-containing protein 1-like [Ruditapes philippinarum]